MFWRECANCGEEFMSVNEAREHYSKNPASVAGAVAVYNTLSKGEVAILDRVNGASSVFELAPDDKLRLLETLRDCAADLIFDYAMGMMFAWDGDLLMLEDALESLWEHESPEEAIESTMLVQWLITSTRAFGDFDADQYLTEGVQMFRGFWN